MKTEEPHFHPVDGQVQGYRRKKTPSQLRREERRRVEKRAEKAQVGKVNEAKPADKVSQADGYVDTDKATLEEKNVAEEESMKAAKATEVSDKNKDVEEHEDEIGMSTLQDEICPDDIYVENVLKYDTPVEQILFKPDDQTDWKDDYIENLIDYNLKITGISMVKINITRSIEGDVASCLVKIQPITRKKIKSLDFPNWRLKAVPYVIILPPHHILVDVLSPKI